MIRFASIPKSASRTLKKLNLLGELEGRCHTTIKEYPEWEKYQWYAVERDQKSWYESWWLECKRSKNMFTHLIGMKFENIDEDLNLLFHPEKFTEIARRPGVNQWIPENFLKIYPKYIQNGLDFKKYCFDVITCNLPCIIIQLKDLNQWLPENGFIPYHENSRENY